MNPVDEIENKNDPECEFNQLEISIFNHRLVKCPACLLHFNTEDDCFEHLLDHFEHSNNFLFQRVGLITWLKKYINKQRNVEIAQVNAKGQDENMNETELKSFSDGDVKLHTFSCRVCNETFFNDHQLGVHSFVHVKLIVPAIDSQLKCPLCDKYFSEEESCLRHLFCHLQVAVTQKIIPVILNWFTVFFASTIGEKAISKYDDYATTLSSPLLSRILVSEISNVKFCKFCKKSVSTIFDLKENHYNCAFNCTPKPFVCHMCNFSAPSDDILLKHFFVRHVACYCGFHGEDFSTFQQHSVNCTVNRNGVLCPICRSNKFATVGGFREHIEESSRRSCSMDLKKNKWKCLLCKVQSTQKDMFGHILSEHVSCMCNYKTKDFKSFCIHTSKCAVKQKALLCPNCGIAKCSTEKHLKDHIVKCLPWKDLKQYCEESNTIRGSVKVENIHKLFQLDSTQKVLTSFKRQTESLPVDFPRKQKKLDTMI